METKKKLTREQEIDARLDWLERDRGRQMREVRDALRVADHDALFQTTCQVGRNAKESRDKVAAHRAERDRRVQEARKAYELALRAAQGELARREREAHGEFEVARHDLDVELRKLNAPLEAEYQRRRAELVEEAQGEVNRIDQEMAAVARPLIDELEAINAKKAQATEEKQAEPPAKDAA